MFCVVYHLFWTFWCVFSWCRWCSSEIIKEWTKDSKKELKEPKFGYVQRHAAAWQRSMPQHVQSASPSQKSEKSMPRHDSFMPRHDMWRQKRKDWRHAAAWPIHAAAWGRVTAFDLFLDIRLTFDVILLSLDI